MKKLPKIMYDQTQFTPIYFFDKKGAWINDKVYKLIENISGYAPDKWYLYTQNKPNAFWFGAYDKSALQKEAETSLKNFSDKVFFDNFQKKAEELFLLTKQISDKYFQEIHGKEFVAILTKKTKVISLLKNIKRVCTFANGYYFLTQPQRLNLIEKKLNQSPNKNELSFIASMGESRTLTAEIEKDIILYAYDIKKAKCTIDQYNKKNQAKFRAIKNKIDKYGFLNWGFYGGAVINLDYLFNKTISLLNDPNKLQKEYKKVISTDNVLNKRKQILKKNKNISEYQLADIAGRLSVLRFDMNTYILCLLNYIKIIVETLSKYYQIPSEDINAYEFEEILQLIKHGKKVNKKTLNERQKAYLRIFSKNNIKTLIGKKALQEIKDLLNSRKKEIEEKQSVKGIITFLPKDKKNISGKVFVLSSSYDADRQLKKFKDGDILVAVQTHPGLISIMKRALAIITDEGGMTSHAAIVSREFKIPCVVGTRLATKIFKTGDSVEIDFTKATVKKTK